MTTINKALLTEAERVASSLDTDEIVSVVSENQETLRALAYGGLCLIAQGNISGFYGLVNMIYTLGFKAGQEHTEPDMEIWNGDSLSD